jgi:hypothetical protein
LLVVAVVVQVVATGLAAVVVRVDLEPAQVCLR